MAEETCAKYRKHRKFVIKLYGNASCQLLDGANHSAINNSPRRELNVSADHANQDSLVVFGG